MKRIGGIGIRICVIVLLSQLVINSEISNPSSEIAWFLHISDLHLSDFIPKRESDLSTLIQNIFPHFNFPTVLISGDLVDSKKKKRSEQRPGEWEQYQRTVKRMQTSLGISNETLLDIRGNHDAFDVPLRSKARDIYRTFGVQGEQWSQKRVLIHPTFGSDSCPVYCLVGVDLSPEIGLRSPTNFFGILTDEIIHEFEAEVTADMQRWYAEDCDPVYIAYGHYPLSIVGKKSRFIAGDQDGLKRVFWKYGVHAWLFGHLHDAFGDHLHHLHFGYASTFLELEVTDWKWRRRFRIMAVDGQHVSFMDFELQNTSSPSIIRPLDSDAVMDGAVVMLTSPPSPYFSPLGNTVVPSDVSSVHALVWPVEPLADPLIVSAKLYCGLEVVKTISMHAVDGGPVHAGNLQKSDMSLCSHSHLSLQVVAETQKPVRVSLSEKRSIESRTQPKEFPHRGLEGFVLTIPWYALFQDLFVSFILFHAVVLLLLPRAFAPMRTFRPNSPCLDNVPNSRGSSFMERCVRFLLAPIRGFVFASQHQLFWWGQLCYVSLMLLGPWFFARVLSDKPLGIVFVPTIYVQAASSEFQSVFSPEMPFRACIYYILVVLPTTLWMVWTLNRCTPNRNGSYKRHKVVLVFYVISGLFPWICFGQFVLSSWQFYGPTSVFLSPILVGWVTLNGLVMWTVVRSRLKCRQE